MYAFPTGSVYYKDHLSLLPLDESSFTGILLESKRLSPLIEIRSYNSAVKFRSILNAFQYCPRFFQKFRPNSSYLFEILPAMYFGIG